VPGPTYGAEGSAVGTVSWNNLGRGVGSYSSVKGGGVGCVGGLDFWPLELLRRSGFEVGNGGRRRFGTGS